MNEVAEIVTDRLRLRPFRDDDLDFVAEMVADPEVMRHYPRTHTREEAWGWITRSRERYAEDGSGLLLAERRADGARIGMVGLLWQEVDGERRPEVAYLVHRPYWRQGYASEAARAVRDHAFRVRDLPRLISLIVPANVPSQGVARKNGMTCGHRTTFRDMVVDVWSVDRPDDPPDAA